MMDTETRLNAIITAHLGIDAASIAPESSFREDMGADSLDMVEMAMAFEDEFRIQITDDEVDVSMGEGTFGKMLELVSAKLAGKREAACG